MNALPRRKIKIVIAEDLSLLRKSFITLLSLFNEFEVIGEFSNGKELIDSLKINSKPSLKANMPDIVLLDLRMNVMNGYEALEIIRKRFKNIKVIIISQYDDEGTIMEVIDKGANSFISKNGEPDDLVRAINTVYKEGFYFNKKASLAMLQNINQRKSKNPFNDSIALSDKEIAVMKEMCESNTNKAISEKLFICSRTVDYHKSNIHKKIKSKKVSDVIKYALRNGIIQLTEY